MTSYQSVILLLRHCESFVKTRGAQFVKQISPALAQIYNLDKRGFYNGEILKRGLPHSQTLVRNDAKQHAL
ncbi:hypothetical protein [Helicobacter sp. MIT 05-5294]|uniref:hypothetical protein n=1 Tax=Helicobacter sp. MIT 05-5294 TaxID=1548150 RepID=UPI0010FEF864|nr:hypothetical protein [Helicobacter sp. MIT 05-5294]TLD88235.1 hypothetical protein LS69_002985 [Helicobacter sp. MIT 05-5294]